MLNINSSFMVKSELNFNVTNFKYMYKFPRNFYSNPVSYSIWSCHAFILSIWNALSSKETTWRNSCYQKHCQGCEKIQTAVKDFKPFHIKNLKGRVPESSLFKIEQVYPSQQQTDKFFHKNWFLKPSSQPYNLLVKLSHTKFFSQNNQDEWVDQFLKQKTNGIFLKVGAVDGYHYQILYFSNENETGQDCW